MRFSLLHFLLVAFVAGVVVGCGPSLPISPEESKMLDEQANKGFEDLFGH